MIKTGFYEVATRKEAERRALAEWAREEQARLRYERRAQRASQSSENRCADAAHSSFSTASVTRRCRTDREQLIIDLNELRRKEQATGLKLDAEKQAIKEKLKRAA